MTLEKRDTSPLPWWFHATTFPIWMLVGGVFGWFGAETEALPAVLGGVIIGGLIAWSLNQDVPDPESLRVDADRNVRILWISVLIGYLLGGLLGESYIGTIMLFITFVPTFRYCRGIRPVIPGVRL